jgi:hypothetical protein
MGGGGGGGYNGGGGGGKGAGNLSADGAAGGGGGGGGSDYANPSATNVTITDGTRAGDGVVTLIYTSTASDLLSLLADTVADFAPKSALQKLVKQIQGYVNDNNTKKACKSFNGFASRVKGMVKVGKLSSSEAAELNQLAQVVQSALGC